MHRPARGQSKTNSRRDVVIDRRVKSEDQLRCKACRLPNPGMFQRRLITSSSQSPGYFAKLYKDAGLTGGHVIKLGPGNDDAAKEVLGNWAGPHILCCTSSRRSYLLAGGLQIGGGINSRNAQEWLDHGAIKVRSSSPALRDNEPHRVRS